MDKKYDEKMYRETKVKIVNPIYAVGAVWLVYSLFLPIYRISDLLIVSALSALAFIAAKRFFPEHTVITPLTSKGSLDARCSELIEQGYSYIGKLEKYSESVTDAAMKSQINEIIAISRQMFDYTAKNPRIATELRNFIEYYYPTTLKLLTAYSEMKDQKLKSENADDIIHKVSSVMSSVVTAFRKQLDMMYTDKQLDVRTDIEVLKSVLASEGLSGASAEPM